MAETNHLPIIFLAFANPPAGARGYLRNLGEEARQLETTLEQAKQKGLCELKVKSYATLDDILTIFREYRNRIAIFHYGGHAHNYHLLLEDAKKGTAAADAGGLAAFLGQQTGLQLVFLNGCATQPQVEGLLAANVPLVIATAQAVKDEVATNFAAHFYRSLASGANVQIAYNEAEAAVRSSVSSGDTRDVYRSSSRDASFEGEELLADRWPWDLYVKLGAEATAEWNLPDTVGDPLFELPPLPDLDPLDSPFRHLHWFEREHAEVFFGRGYEIRKLYKKVTASAVPIILLYGQSGVGKSSLLAAGLLPRLEANYNPCYTRRDRDQGLLGTLRKTLDGSDQNLSLAQAWHKLDTMDRPLVAVIDQVEEVFTRPQADQPDEDELDVFLTALQDLFVNPGQRPPGKLILGFRKEWLADIEDRLKQHWLPYIRIPLERLERKGIVEAIVGPARLPHLQDTFGLTVAETLLGEEKLPDIIADDLLEDRESPIAPTLQILLTKMWERAKAKNYDQPQFDLALYRSLKREGLLLKDFLDQQLKALADWREEVVASGLALDLLAFHTTPQGMSEQRSQAKLLETYAHRQDEIKPIVQQCEDLYLLVDPSKNQPNQPKASRLAHDALAPLVRARFEESDNPGQRARRILENRAVEWEGDQKGAPLDEVDLDLVEAGRDGMRAWNKDEERLVAASRCEQAKRQRNRRIWRGVGVAAAIFILLFAGVAAWQWQVSQKRLANETMARQGERVALASAEASAAEALTAQQDAEEARDEAEARRVDAEKAQVEAEKQANLALSRLLTIQSDNQLNANDNQLALLLAVEAGNIADTPEAVDALYTALPRIRQSLRNFGPVVNAGWNQDGTRLITIGMNGMASVWDWSKAELYSLNFSNNSGPITQVVWNPDGTHILTTSMDGAARIWQIEPDPTEHGNDTGNGPLILRPPGPVIGATWNSDSTRILTTWCHAIIRQTIFNVCQGAFSQVWDAQTGAKLASFPHPGWGLLVPPLPGTDLLATWNAKGTLILTTGCDGDQMPPDLCDNVVVEIWDLKTAERLASLIGHSSWVNHAVWNSDGNRILTASDDGSVRVWDAETGNQLGPSMDHEFKVEKATWNADETRVHTSTRGGTAHIWDVKSGFEMQRFARADKMVWSSHGTRILAADRDGSLRVLDAETQAELITLLGHKGQVAQVAWNAEDTRLFTLGFDGTVRLWDAESITELPTLYSHTAWVEQAVWNASGNRILTANTDATARVWDANTGVTLLSLAGHSDGVNQAVWNPRETRILTASSDRTARVWDAKTGDTVLTLLGHTDEVEQAVWNADDTHILTASRDGTVRVWDAETGDELTRLNHPEPVGEAAWNAGGTRILTFSLDNTTRVWGVEPNREASVLVELSDVSQAVWSPDDTRILTISSDDSQAIRVLNAETGVELVNLVGHSKKVNQAVWNADGTHILTASEDGTAKVWDAQTGDEILSLNHGDGISQAAWNADGTLIFTRDSSSVRLWDSETGASLGIRSALPGITHVTWNANGSRFLVTNRSDNVRQYFAPRTDILIERACQLVSRNLSMDEWRRFTGDKPYRATCPDLPIEKVK